MVMSMMVLRIRRPPDRVAQQHLEKRYYASFFYGKKPGPCGRGRTPGLKLPPLDRGAEERRDRERMQLTKFSDYSLRVLMFAAAAGDRLVTIEETSRTYGISRAHLMKVVTALTRARHLEGVRGRSGGFRLARPPEEISLGDVLRLTEPDFDMVECFGTGNQCAVTGACRLPSVVGEALDAFMSVLDKYTLADVALRPVDFPVVLRQQPEPADPTKPAP